MKRILLSILVIGVLLLSACGTPAPPKESVSYAMILEFGELAADNETAKWENELGRWKPATAVINGEEKALTSRYFKGNTHVAIDNQDNILLVFEWNDEGSQLSEQITSRLIGKPLGIFEGDQPLLGADGQPIAPIILSVIKDWGHIQGLTLDEANELSMLLNTSR